MGEVRKFKIVDYLVKRVFYSHLCKIMFKTYVQYHFHLPRINKRGGGGWNKIGLVENFSKFNEWGGGDYSVHEST